MGTKNGVLLCPAGTRTRSIEFKNTNVKVLTIKNNTKGLPSKAIDVPALCAAVALHLQVLSGPAFVVLHLLSSSCLRVVKSTRTYLSIQTDPLE